MKKYAWLIYIVSCFIIGFVFTYLVYIGLWARLIDGFRDVPIWLYFIGAIFVFYMTLTLHEFGHIIAFKVQGIHIRALYLTIFVFYKDEKGWHFTIRPKLWILFGGLVVPDLPQVKNDKDMKYVSTAFSKSLMTAPIVTISVMGLMILVFFIVWLFGSGSFGFGLLTISMIYTVILSSIYIYTFKLNTKNIYGDLVAYRKMKEDPFFQFTEIYQYQSFSLSVDRENKYFYEKACQLLTDVPRFKHDIFIIVTIMAYLEGVIHLQQPISADIDAKLSKLPINQFTKSVEGLTLVYELAEYYYCRGLVEKAYHLVNQAKHHAGKHVPMALKNYMLKRAEHVMHITYHDDFLADKKNIYIGQAWLFEPISDPYDDLIKQHEKLPFQVYVCEMPPEKEKMSSAN